MARYAEDLRDRRNWNRNRARRYGRDFRYGGEYRRGPERATGDREGRSGRPSRGFESERGHPDGVWFGGYGGQGMEEDYMRYYGGRRVGPYDRGFRRGYDRDGRWP